MGIDFGKTLDAVGDGVKNVGEVSHKSMENFHKNYVSKITPKDGKFGDATKYLAEMVPGVSEYNAIREGNWKACAIAVGIDAAMIGLTVSTAGLATGAVVGVKVGTEVGKTAVKTVVREGTESVAKKAIKEGNEAVAEKTVNEGVEAIAKKTVKEGTEEVRLGQNYQKNLKEVSPYPETIKEINIGEWKKQDTEVIKAARQEFNNKRESLIEDWERTHGKEWPKYYNDIYSENKVLIREKGDKYDAHHIKPLEYGGRNAVDNITPLHAKDHYDRQGVHSSTSILQKIKNILS